LIRIFKYFIIIIFISSSVVWLSNNPGNVEIFWKEYLIQTNLVGLLLILISFSTVLILIYGISKGIKEIPINYKNLKKEKYLTLGNKALDDVTINLMLGDLESVEKNSRKLKKYLGNDLFSTYMFFYTSLMKNNISESKKYLKVLENMSGANYVAKKSTILILLKEANFEEAKSKLILFCKDYPKDLWFVEKLSNIYVFEKNWNDALRVIEKIKYTKSKKIKNKIANLRVLSGKKPLEALKISNESIHVINESIKYYIDKSNVKKAAAIIQKNWNKFFCLIIVENFINYKKKNASDSLKRYKLIAKVLKSSCKESDESKLAIAVAAYESSIWGESQKYLDLIPKENWDKRVIDLYGKLSQKSPKIRMPNVPNSIKNEPKWICNFCNSKFDNWEFLCAECDAIDSIYWSKSKINTTQNIVVPKKIIGESFWPFSKDEEKRLRGMG